MFVDVAGDVTCYFLGALGTKFAEALEHHPSPHEDDLLLGVTQPFVHALRCNKKERDFTWVDGEVLSRTVACCAQHLEGPT